MGNVDLTEVSFGATKSRPLAVLKAWLTLGRESQSFLGARWIRFLLKVCPEGSRRALALRLLALSPHYFKKPGAEHRGLGYGAYLESEFKRNESTRRKILAEIVSPHVAADSVVLDYGCGPGFLARHLGRVARKVVGTDISLGALASARILNDAANVEYVQAGRPLAESVSDGSVDVVVSFAVVQHLREDALHEMMEACRSKLKPGGTLVLQVQLDDPHWHNEEQWRADTSIKGRVKYRYGLNCFARDPKALLGLLRDYGFQQIVIRNIRDMVTEHFDDICAQQLVTAVRSGKKADLPDRPPQSRDDLVGLA